MNSTDTIQAISPIVGSFFKGEIPADKAMELIGQTLKANREGAPAEDERDIKAGFRVIDAEGGTHEYPNARAVDVDRGDLYLLDDNNKAIVVFHRWDHAGRIA